MRPSPLVQSVDCWSEDRAVNADGWTLADEKRKKGQGNKGKGRGVVLSKCSLCGLLARLPGNGHWTKSKEARSTDCFGSHDIRCRW